MTALPVNLGRYLIVERLGCGGMGLVPLQPAIVWPDSAPRRST